MIQKTLEDIYTILQQLDIQPTEKNTTILTGAYHSLKDAKGLADALDADLGRLAKRETELEEQLAEAKEELIALRGGKVIQIREEEEGGAEHA